MQRDVWSPAERRRARRAAVVAACMRRPAAADHVDVLPAPVPGGSPIVVSDGPTPPEAFRWFTRHAQLRRYRVVAAAAVEHLEDLVLEDAMLEDAILEGLEPLEGLEYGTPDRDPVLLARALVCAASAPPAAA